MTASATDVQALTSASAPGVVDRLRLRAGPACRPFTAACGLRIGATVLIFDDRGRFDLLRITDVLADVVSVASMDGRRLPVYPVGSSIISVDIHSYYFDHARTQLRRHDGWLTDAPVLDNVVALSFQYFGPSFRTIRRSDQGRPTCTTSSQSFQSLSSTTTTEVEISSKELTDGTWCGIRSSVDVDLFRVRRVRVHLRLQASSAEHRGSDRQMFARPGHAADYRRFVPDATVRFDVALRNQ